MNNPTEQNYSVLDNLHKKAVQQFDAYQEKHSKVLAVRADIRYPSDYGEVRSNRDIVKTIAKVKQTFERKGLDPEYIWAREQNVSDHPHYHCLLLLDGQKTRSPKAVYDVLEKHWQRTIGSSVPGLVDYCNGTPEKPHANGKIINRSEGRPEYLNRQINYIAKPEGKGPQNDGLRDFGMSRLSSSPRK